MIASASSSDRRLAIDVTGAQAKVDARLVAIHREHREARHGRRQRLRAAHAAEPRGQDPASARIAGKMRARTGAESLVRALHDALRADVDPGARRHLAVHHQSLAVELVEMLPGRPVRHEIRVRDQHARRIHVRAENADRFSGLHEQRLVVLEAAQDRENRVESFPVARGFAYSAVDDELVGVLRNFRVEVVLQHPERRFGQPAAAIQHLAAWRAHDARAGGHRSSFCIHGLRGYRALPRWHTPRVR